MLNKFLKTNMGAVLGAIICVFLWGTAFPFIKLSYSQLGIGAKDISSQVLFAGERFFISGVLVFIFCLIFRRKGLKTSKQATVPMLLLGLIQTAGQYFCAYVGTANTTGTKSSVITACNAFFSVLLAPLFFKNEKFKLNGILGCIIGFAGVLIINIDEIAVGGVSFFGEGMLVLSTICFAGGSFLSKNVASKNDAFAVTAYPLLIGGAILILCGLFMGGNVVYNNFLGILSFMYLAILSALATSLWTALLGLHDVGRICIFNLLMPLFGTVFSGLLLGEQIIKWENIVSLLLVSAGIFLVNYTDLRKSRVKKCVDKIDSLQQDKGEDKCH